MKNLVTVEGPVARIAFGTRFGLTGHETLVDVADLERLVAAVGNCSLVMTTSNVSKMRYASWRNPGERRQIYVHRFILGFPSLQVDHKDRDGLNNTRNNLRPATHRQNALNRVHTCSKIVDASHYRFRPSRNCYDAQIYIDGKQYHKSSRNEDVVKAWVAEMRVKQAEWRKSVTTF
jgi:hypothetical protein